jgi:hypothetical protein
MYSQSAFSSLLRATLASASLGIAASATPIEITVADPNPTRWGFSGDGSLTAGGRSDRGNFGIAGEDNETEPGTIAGQQWDMEAFVLTGRTLSIVGGFDMLNGVPAHNVGAGDLFIKVGGTAPGSNPWTNTGNVRNSLYNYTYAVDLTMPSKHGNPSFGPTAQVFSLNSNTWLNTVQNDNLGANPWKYANSLNTNPSVATPIAYTTGLASSHSRLTSLGLNLHGSYHNILTVDLSFLGPLAPGTKVYFSYTMECGNDSIKGVWNVPDTFSSTLLILAGFASVLFFAVRSRPLS